MSTEFFASFSILGLACSARFARSCGAAPFHLLRHHRSTRDAAAEREENDPKAYKSCCLKLGDRYLRHCRQSTQCKFAELASWMALALSPPERRDSTPALGFI